MEYNPKLPDDAGPMARLAWSVAALDALARAAEAAAYAALVRDTYARLGRPVPTGLLP